MQRRWQPVGIATVSGIVILTAALGVPFPHTFSMSNVAIYDLDPDCTGISTLAGTSVSFVWHAPSFTGFAVVSCSTNQVPYEGGGTNGSGTFVSAGGVYEFGSLCPEGPCAPADVVGTYTGAALAL